jgi:hypothetical protein
MTPGRSPLCVTRGDARTSLWSNPEPTAKRSWSNVTELPGAAVTAVECIPVAICGPYRQHFNDSPVDRLSTVDGDIVTSVRRSSAACSPIRLCGNRKTARHVDRVRILLSSTARPTEGRTAAMTRMFAQQFESGARPGYSAVGMPSYVRGYLSQPIMLWTYDHKRQATTENRGRSMH